MCFDKVYQNTSIILTNLHYLYFFVDKFESIASLGKLNDLYEFKYL